MGSVSVVLILLLATCFVSCEFGRLCSSRHRWSVFTCYCPQLLLPLAQRRQVLGSKLDSDDDSGNFDAETGNNKAKKVQNQKTKTEMEKPKNPDEVVNMILFTFSNLVELIIDCNNSYRYLEFCDLGVPYAWFWCISTKYCEIICFNSERMRSVHFFKIS